MLAICGASFVGKIARGQWHGQIILAGIHLHGALEQTLVMIAYGRGIVHGTGTKVAIAPGRCGRLFE